MKLSNFLSCSLLITASLLTACTKEQQESSGSSGATSSTPFKTDCGTVINASLENPVDPKGGIRGRVTVSGGNLLIMRPEKGGDILIKLHGIGTPYNDASRAGAERMMRELAKEEAIFFQAASTCTTSISGSTSSIGQLFTASGKSYSEAILREGYARVENDACSASLITSCYTAIVEEVASNFAGELEAFLWKPVSDSNDRLAIHTSPSDTVVQVAGETGTPQGPGNGYGNLSRFSKPGCAYGKNVSVRVLNSKGVPYRFNGQLSVTVPDGCQRYCIKDGALALCPKR